MTATLGVPAPPAPVPPAPVPGSPGVALPSTDAGPAVVGSLSPSRAADFLTCPLLYRFRVVDRLPEPPSHAATRGSVVHAALERLFDLAAAQRQPGAAGELVEPAWLRLLADEPGLAELFADDADGTGLAEFLGSARRLVETYFALEDPTRLEPAARELFVETLLPLDPMRLLHLRGYVDRLDVAATGEVRVVDYKSGRAPSPGWEQRAMFQLRFYALLLWRMRGVVPRRLQLIYLGSAEVLRYEPDEADLRAVERKLVAVWAAIERAHRTGDWRPRPGRLCDGCDHRARCPAWGGTPPPLPGSAGDSAGDSLPAWTPARSPTAGPSGSPQRV